MPPSQRHDATPSAAVTALGLGAGPAGARAGPLTWGPGSEEDGGYSKMGDLKSAYGGATTAAAGTGLANTALQQPRLHEPAHHPPAHGNFGLDPDGFDEDEQALVDEALEEFKFVRKTLPKAAMSHEEGRTEFRCLDYSPLTNVRPVDLADTLRPVKASRKIRLMINITVYNEEGECSARGQQQHMAAVSREVQLQARYCLTAHYGPGC
jgi:hypothetical protein